jgi:hypothetical protein
MKGSLRIGAVCAFVASLAAVGSAQVFVYTANLDGLSEAPPNPSPGTGFTTVTMDSIAYSMRVQANFANLVGTTTAAHIHAPTAAPLTGTAPVATELPSFTGFPLGVTSGSYDHTFDMTQAANWNPTFLANHGNNTIVAFFAFVNYMDQGRTYLNIHSTVYGGGEIRGFLQPVPEPGTMVALGLGSAVLLRRIRRRKTA